MQVLLIETPAGADKVFFMPFQCYLIKHIVEKRSVPGYQQIISSFIIQAAKPGCGIC